MVGVNWPCSLEELADDASLSLLVFWRRGKVVEAREVPIAGDVTDYLREAANRTLQEFRNLEGTDQVRTYSVEMVLEREEVFVAASSQVPGKSPVDALLFPDSPYPQVGPAELEGVQLWMYAAVTGAGDDRRAFVKKGNAHVDARRGRLFTALAGTLSRVRNPILVLADRFELVVAPGGVIALSHPTFDAVFAVAALQQEEIERLIDNIDHYLKFHADSRRRLAARCSRDPRLWRLLRAINARGHLRNVTADRVRSYLEAVSIDHERFLRGDELFFEDGDVHALLHLLNEDHFTGGLSDEAFVSSRKVPRDQ